jgi:hypothetical protein
MTLFPLYHILKPHCQPGEEEDVNDLRLLGRTIPTTGRPKAPEDRTAGPANVLGHESRTEATRKRIRTGRSQRGICDS